MNFIQNQIDRGLTRIIITNRGVKGSSESFKVFHYNIESVDDYNKIVGSELHASHEYGFSVGFAPAN